MRILNVHKYRVASFWLTASMLLGAFLLPILCPPARSESTQSSATTQAAATSKKPTAKADDPSPRGGHEKPDAAWLKRHEEFVALAKKGGIDLYFTGDSITDFWRRKGKTVWAKNFSKWNAANFGIGGDNAQQLLWRLQNGELEGVNPKVVVIMIGTNNIGSKVEDIAAGVTAVVKEVEKRTPDSKILLLGLLPRGPKIEGGSREKIKEVNAILKKLDNGNHIKFLDIGAKYLNPDGSIILDLMPDTLHPSEKGYEVWAEAITPILTEWLGESDAKSAAERKRP